LSILDSLFMMAVGGGRSPWRRLSLRVTTRESVGDRLRQARERRGLALEDAARATRIDRDFLEALERDASPEEFPEPMYARAFLREYARYLGLRDRRLMQDYRAVHPMKEQPPFGLPPIHIDRARAPWGKRILLGLSLGALVALAVFSARAARGPDTGMPEGPVVPSSAAPGGSGATTKQEEDPGPTFQGLNVVLRVVNGPSWIRVTKAGEVLFEGTQEPGFRDTFHAQEELFLQLGAPAAVRLRANGERVELPTTGAVYQATLVANEQGRVRVVPLVT
jgi:transcriptional regulator with XRE-family HTH domain